MDVQESHTVLTSQNPAASSTSGRRLPRSGDLLVSRRMARADVYAISVVPAEALLTTIRFDIAVETAGELARRREVDGWYTCDDTHFVPISRYRT